MTANTRRRDYPTRVVGHRVDTYDAQWLRVLEDEVAVLDPMLGEPGLSFDTPCETVRD